MDAELQKLVAGSSNSLQFLTHPRKSLFSPKAAISLTTRLLKEPPELYGQNNSYRVEKQGASIPLFVLPLRRTHSV
jgi:hypothetical protein